MRKSALKNNSSTHGKASGFFLPSALILIMITGILIISCIKRDNDWDPIFNKKTASFCSDDTLLALNGEVSKILLRMDALALDADLKNDSLQNMDDRNKAKLESNMMIQYSNTIISEKNQEIETANQLQKTIDSLEYLTGLDTLFSLQFDSSSVIDLISRYAWDSISLFSLFAEIEIRCPDFENRTKTLRDSASAALSENAESIRRLLISTEAMGKSIDSIDKSVSDSNLIIKLENHRIHAYNDSVDKVKLATRIKIFPTITEDNEDSLKILLHTALPGDTFIIQGAIRLNGNLSMHSIHGTALNHIALIGNPLMENVLFVQSGAFIDSGEYIDISNLHFKGSKESGLKLNNHSDNITLNNCIIEGNYGFGLDISTSGISVTNCKIFNNGASGINFVPSSPSEFTLKLNNVLIVKNLGAGLDLTSPYAEIKYVTISHNTSDGILIRSPAHSSISIYNSIISFNGGFGISQKNDVSDGNVGFEWVDFFQNASGNPPDGASGTIAGVDPNFTDTLQNDYSISPPGEIYTLETQQNTIIGFR